MSLNSVELQQVFKLAPTTWLSPSLQGPIVPSGDEASTPVNSPACTMRLKGDQVWDLICNMAQFILYCRGVQEPFKGAQNGVACYPLEGLQVR